MKKAISFLLCLLLGMAAGFIAAPSVGRPSVFKLAVFGAALVFSIYVHLILHEGGHLLAGLASGYRFVSFRVGSFTFIRDDKGLAVRRFKVAGTGGQCLMAPPRDVPLEQLPTRLYNAGGVLANALVGVSALLVFLAMGRQHYIVVETTLALAMVGIVMALLNGIPMKPGGVSNDGRNLLTLGRSAKATREFGLLLLVNEATQNGTRPTEMPAEWFDGEVDDYADAMQVNMELMRASRDIDGGRLPQARTRLEGMVAHDGEVLGLLLMEAKCELVFVALAQGDRERAEALLDKPLRAYIDAHAAVMSSKKRVQCAMALLLDGDRARAEALLHEVERRRDGYLMQGEVASDIHLMRQLLSTP